MLKHTQFWKQHENETAVYLTIYISFFTQNQSFSPKLTFVNDGKPEPGDLQELQASVLYETDHIPQLLPCVRHKV